MSVRKITADMENPNLVSIRDKFRVLKLLA